MLLQGFDLGKRKTRKSRLPTFERRDFKDLQRMCLELTGNEKEYIYIFIRFARLVCLSCAVIIQIAFTSTFVCRLLFHHQTRKWRHQLPLNCFSQWIYCIRCQTLDASLNACTLGLCGRMTFWKIPFFYQPSSRMLNFVLFSCPCLLLNFPLFPLFLKQMAEQFWNVRLLRDRKTVNVFKNKYGRGF